MSAVAKDMDESIIIVFWIRVNSLPNDKILDWMKLKAFADDKIKCCLIGKICFGGIKSIVEKGENAAFSSFPTMF